MNINKVNANNNLIDAQSINKVSENLFSALQKKSVDFQKTDLSGFNRPTKGIDLYSQKTDLNIQRQIALTSSGAFSKMNLAQVQALNALAAQQLYANTLEHQVGGKMTITANVNDFEFISKTDDIQNLINVFEANKDKKDSNPFYFGDFSSETPKQEAQQ